MLNLVMVSVDALREKEILHFKFNYTAQIRDNRLALQYIVLRLLLNKDEGDRLSTVWYEQAATQLITNDLPENSTLLSIILVEQREGV
ncbi:unnamed protein product [Paramecium sonneborni]|uniref:Uncharacterized protein n=1 Tax=Paramecium sonneborni TaxID=65129 RepID=A0A8S1RRX7_9CILI|nr:unnamed protein product [Paramecium sonneborni]